jgi:signal recognition particle subunit SRP19
VRARKPFILFWPQYFDSKRTRAQGRRVPIKYAIDRVTAKDLNNSARKLGYNTQLETGYKYPRTWWDDSGRIAVDVKGKKKSTVLIEIAKELKQSQSKK